MLLPAFDFIAPSSLEEAGGIMQRHGKNARILAGGTDLLVNMKKKLLEPARLVSLHRIEALRQISTAGEMLEIGAGVTVASIADSTFIRKIFPALAAGARALGSPLIRNLATIGGNIGSARPAADLLPALIVYAAEVTLVSSAGTRQASIQDLFTGPGMTIIRENEIISKIGLLFPGNTSGAGYINLGVRKVQDCNLVNVAAGIVLDRQGKRIKSARIAMGSVGPTPLRALSAEKLLIGGSPGDALFEKAGRAAMEDCRPIPDFRGSAEYRRAMIGVLTQRALNLALQQAHR